MIRRLLVVLLVAGIAQSALAQPRAKARTRKRAVAQAPALTMENFAYGKDSPRQVMDFWQAETEEPAPVVFMIHGGGWRAGDKSTFRPAVKGYLEQGISVAAINYRYVDQAAEYDINPPVKAPLSDAARALQTLRSKAKEWNIDPKRIAATGGSAGACTSLWLAFHDDMAKPDSKDPVERESTRLTCAAVQGAQTSLDPVQVREWIPNAVYGAHAFEHGAAGERTTQAFEALIAKREEIMPLIKEYSPMELVSKDDPPIYLTYPNQKKPPKMGQEEPDPTHSAMYGVKLAEKLDDLGVEAIVTYPGREDTKYGSPEEFIISKLKDK